MDLPYSLDRFLQKRLGWEGSEEVLENIQKLDAIQFELNRLSKLYREIGISLNIHAKIPEKKADAERWAIACEKK